MNSTSGFKPSKASCTVRSVFKILISTSGSRSYLVAVRTWNGRWQVKMQFDICSYQDVIVAVLKCCLLLSEKLAGMSGRVLPYPSNPGFLSGRTTLEGGGAVHWADWLEAKYSVNTSKSAESWMKQNGSPLWQWRHSPQGWIAIPMKTQVTSF